MQCNGGFESKAKNVVRFDQMQEQDFLDDDVLQK